MNRGVLARLAVPSPGVTKPEVQTEKGARGDGQRSPRSLLGPHSNNVPCIQAGAIGYLAMISLIRLKAASAATCGLARLLTMFAQAN